jgi:hypothetical protein
MSEGWGDSELGSPEGGNDGSERSDVVSFGESVRDHVGGECENRIITGPTEWGRGPSG